MSGGGGGASTPTEADRQRSREFGAQREAAEALRNQVREQGVDTRQLDQAINQLRSLESGTYLGGPQGINQLQSQVIAGIREVEYALWRRFNANDTRPALGVRGQVPAEYQQLVEEYYRQLARPTSGGRPGTPPDR